MSELKKAVSRVHKAAREDRVNIRMVGKTVYAWSLSRPMLYGFCVAIGKSVNSVYESDQHSVYAVRVRNPEQVKLALEIKNSKRKLTVDITGDGQTFLYMIDHFVPHSPSLQKLVMCLHWIWDFGGYIRFFSHESMAYESYKQAFIEHSGERNEVITPLQWEAILNANLITIDDSTGW